VTIAVFLTEAQRQQLGVSRPGDVIWLRGFPSKIFPGPPPPYHRYRVVKIDADRVEVERIQEQP
jgi:hypothetical protein